MKLQKFTTTDGELFSYSLKISKRTRSMRLAVYRDTRVILTVPRFVPQFIFERFIKSKVEWLYSRLEYIKNLPPPLSVGDGKKEYLNHKEDARSLVLAKLDEYNQFYNYSWNRVSIKNTKSRWGSCSSKGNLNFSYKLALVTSDLLDYVVVHELCHLKEMNHSKEFWNLVEKTIPNYKELRKQLKLLR